MGEGYVGIVGRDDVHRSESKAMDGSCQQEGDLKKRCSRGCTIVACVSDHFYLSFFHSQPQLLLLLPSPPLSSFLAGSYPSYPQITKEKKKSKFRNKSKDKARPAIWRPMCVIASGGVYNERQIWDLSPRLQTKETLGNKKR
jgi:hypothetical protein